MIPEETDPTALFITAGMQPLVPYLLGEKHPQGKRLANIQKCIRTSDIDEVGDNRHLTFFEMMGNWSLGDYFKKEAIEWSFEFLTSPSWLGLDSKRIYVTTFVGDKEVPQDKESVIIWQKIFKKNNLSFEVSQNGNIAENVRIIPLGREDNFWGPIGDSGPCGPDTEIFYDTCPSKGALKGSFSDLVNSGRLIEIWNNVFMEFNKDKFGKYKKLSQRNVDTGIGVERTIAVLTEKENVFETELFQPIFKVIEKKSLFKYKESSQTKKSFRIIADHLKAAIFIITDGVTPSNAGRGYVLRRLIRRAVRYGQLIKIQKGAFNEIIETVIKMYKDFYPELKEKKETIVVEIKKEEEKFKKTLERGLKKFSSLKVNHNLLEGKVAFDLYQTYGFPLEITKELAEEKGFRVDEEGFYKELNHHKELSRTATKGMFKGGLAEAKEETARLHTATHLLHAALRKVLGEHVLQKGSNITAERLRFDFSHPQQLTDEEKEKVENLVNQAIRADLPVTMEEMSVSEAKKRGALGVFGSKYGEKVKVYIIGNKDNPFSQEICGGPHVKRTVELGHFKIKKEKSSGAGVRRIKAVIE